MVGLEDVACGPEGLSDLGEQFHTLRATAQHGAGAHQFPCGRKLLRGGRSIRVVPRDLWGALWLQFADAVASGARYERCRECTTWFELSPQAARADRLYCSEGCKQKAYRERKAEALRLHGEGKTAGAIARSVGSDAATVKGWLAAAWRAKK